VDTATARPQRKRIRHQDQDAGRRPGRAPARGPDEPPVAGRSGRSSERMHAGLLARAEVVQRDARVQSALQRPMGRPGRGPSGRCPQWPRPWLRTSRPPVGRRPGRCERHPRVHRRHRGESHYKFHLPATGSQVRIASTFGVLRLALEPGTYEWRLVSVSGATRDAGNAACH